MSVRAATDWKVVVNGVVLSSWAHSVSVDDTKEKIEASGFSPTGNRTYVQGLREQTVVNCLQHGLGHGRAVPHPQSAV